MSQVPSDRAPKLAPLIVCLAVALTVVMVLFPPYTSLGGTEYAFALTGPEWVRAMGDIGADLGLSARLHWPLLFTQFAAVWSTALGAKRLLVSHPKRFGGVG
jgi:hypothetical protein